MLGEKLKNLNTRGLVLFNIAETRSVRVGLDNHLRTHEEETKAATERRWKIYLLIGSCFLTAALAAATGFGVVLFAFLL